MGASSSKTAAAAGRGAAARKFPSRAPGASVPHSAPRQRAAPESTPQPPRGDGSKDQAIRADAMDPDFASGGFSERLHQMGVVSPNPTFSPSSTAAPMASAPSPRSPAGPIFPSARNNTTLSVLEARRALQQRADEDFENMGRSDSPARRFLDMRAALDAMAMRQRGVPAADIEKRLRLEPGILDKLGRPQVLTHISTGK